MTWAPPTIVRISDADTLGAVCEASTCFNFRHGAVYRFETVNGDTGEVRRRLLCLGAAARLAFTLKATFPPGCATVAAPSQAKGT